MQLRRVAANWHGIEGCDVNAYYVITPARKAEVRMQSFTEHWSDSSPIKRKTHFFFHMKRKLMHVLPIAILATRVEISD